MAAFDDKTESVINEAVDRAVSRFDQSIGQRVNETVERVAGFYYEKLHDDIQLIHEAFDINMAKLDSKVDRDEFDILDGAVRLNRLALMETTRDIADFHQRIEQRIRILENA
jgi:hypothetical protein